MKILGGEHTVEIYLDNADYPKVTTSCDRYKNFNTIKFYESAFGGQAVTIHISNGQLQQLTKELEIEDPLRSQK